MVSRVTVMRKRSKEMVTMETFILWKCCRSRAGLLRTSEAPEVRKR